MWTRWPPCSALPATSCTRTMHEHIEEETVRLVANAADYMKAGLSDLAIIHHLVHEARSPVTSAFLVSELRTAQCQQAQSVEWGQIQVGIGMIVFGGIITGVSYCPAATSVSGGVWVVMTELLVFGGINILCGSVRGMRG